VQGIITNDIRQLESGGILEAFERDNRGCEGQVPLWRCGWEKSEGYSDVKGPG